MQNFACKAFLEVIYLILMSLERKFAATGFIKFQNIGCLQKDDCMHLTKFKYRSLYFSRLISYFGPLRILNSVHFHSSEDRPL